MTTNLNTTLSTYGASHATLASYTAGFFFSIILTLIPYEIVREHIMEGTELLYTITLFALLQGQNCP